MKEQEVPSESGLVLIHQALFFLFFPHLSCFGLLFRERTAIFQVGQPFRQLPVSAVSQHAERFPRVTKIPSCPRAVRLSGQLQIQDDTASKLGGEGRSQTALHDLLISFYQRSHTGVGEREGGGNGDIDDAAMQKKCESNKWISVCGKGELLKPFINFPLTYKMVWT